MHSITRHYLCACVQGLLGSVMQLCKLFNESALWLSLHCVCNTLFCCSVGKSRCLSSDETMSNLTKRNKTRWGPWPTECPTILTKELFEYHESDSIQWPSVDRQQLKWKQPTIIQATNLLASISSFITFSCCLEMVTVDGPKKIQFFFNAPISSIQIGMMFSTSHSPP